MQKGHVAAECFAEMLDQQMPHLGILREDKRAFVVRKDLFQLLRQAHPVGATWYIFAGIGVVAAIMIYAYGRWIQRLSGPAAATR